MSENLAEVQLGKDLVAAGLLTEVQLSTSREYQASLGGKLVDIIRKLGFVPDERLNALVAQRENMRSIDLTGCKIDLGLMARVPRKVIERHEAVPIHDDDGTILLAMSESSDFQAMEDFQFLTSRRIETALAPRSQVLEVIHRYYSEHPEPGEPEPEPAPEEALLRGVADPQVAAALRALIKKGALTPEEWQGELS